jgi:hypothetical protein
MLMGEITFTAAMQPRSAERVPAPFLLRGVPHAGKTPVPKPGECYPGLRRRLFWEE